MLSAKAHAALQLSFFLCCLLAQHGSAQSAVARGDTCEADAGQEILRLATEMEEQLTQADITVQTITQLLRRQRQLLEKMQGASRETAGDRVAAVPAAHSADLGEPISAQMPCALLLI